MSEPATPPSPERFLIDERLDDVGAAHRTTLRLVPDQALAIEHDGVELGRLSALAVATVMRRYARPLDPEVEVSGPTLVLGAHRLRRMRWRAAVDAIGRDYLVWEVDGEPPAAALAVSVAAALRHLATATRRTAPGP